MEFCLDEKILEENTRYIQAELSRPYYDLFRTIQSREKNDRNKTITVWNSIESMFSLQKTIYQTTITQLKVSETEEKDFLQAHSYMLAAEEGLDILRNENDSTKTFGGRNLKFKTGPNSLMKEIVNIYKENIINHTDNEEDVVAITKGFFRWIKDNANKICESEKYPQNFTRYKNLIKSITDFKRLNSKHSQGTIVEKKYVVGNKELISQIENSLNLLFLYDVNQKFHPHNMRYGSYVQRILAIGEPGCGKSFTLEAMVNEAMKFSEMYEKPLIVRNISNDLKSKYYSESAHNIKKLFQEVNKGNELYLIIADDIDTVIFGRKEQEQSENISVFGEFIKNIESVASENKGNYLLLATTNKPANIDYALIRRFQRKIITKGPETKDDYLTLFNNKLSGYLKDGLLKIDDWEQIGSSLYESRVPGSLVADITTSLSDIITKVDIPLKIYSLDGRKTSATLPKIYKQIREKDVLEEIRLKINEYRCFA